MDRKTVVFIFIIILASIFRLSYLDWGLPNAWHPYSYHPDEAKQLDSIANMHPERLDFNPDEFIYPSLQYYINAAGLGISGLLGFVKLVPDINFYITYPHELAKLFYVGRIVTVLFALATVLLVYFIGKRLYSEKVGMLAALILAIIPQHIIESHYMTVDVPLTFWITLTLFFSTYILKENKWWPYVAAGLAAGFATATKYPGAFAWFFVIGAHYLKPFIKSTLHEEERNLLKLFVSGLLVILGFFLASPYVFIDYQHSIPAIIGQWNLGQTTQFDNLGGNGIQYHKLTYSLFAAFPFLLGIPMYALFLYSFVKNFKTNRTQLMLLMSFALPFFLLFGTSRFVMLRYYLPLLPAFALIIGSTIIENKNKIFRIFSALCILYLFAFSLTQNYKFKDDTQDRAWIWIHEKIPEGATIFVSPWAPLRYTPFNDPAALTGREVNDSEIFRKRNADELDLGRYRVLTLYNLSNANALLEKYNPDYIIISSLDWAQYYRNQSPDHDYQAGLQFYKELREPEQRCAGSGTFTICTESARWQLGGVIDDSYLNQAIYEKLDSRFSSGYASPRIEIYKRKNFEGVSYHRFYISKNDSKV